MRLPKLTLSKVATGAFWYSLAGLLTKGSSILLLPFFTKWMVPAEYGLLSIVLVIQRLALALVSAGLGAAVVRYYHLYRNDDERFRKFFSSAFWFQILLAIAVALSLFLLPSLGWFGSGVISFWLLLPLSLAVMFNPPRELMNQLFTAREDHRQASNNQLIGFFVATVASLILVGYFDLGAVGRVWGIAIGAIVLAGALVAQKPSREFLAFSVDRTELKKSLSFGLPFMPYAFCVSAFASIDQWLILNEFGTAQVGIYSTYRAVAFGVTFIFIGINKSWFPRFFHLKENQKKTTKGQWIIACLLPLLASGFVIIYPVVMPLLVHKDYLLADDPMVPLAISVLLMGIFTTQTCALQHLGKTSWLVLIGAAGVGGCYLGGQAFIGSHGLSGAAIGLIVGYATMLLLQMAVCVWFDRDLSHVIFPVISAALGLGVISLVSHSFTDVSLLSVIFLSFVVTGFYFAVWFFGHQFFLKKERVNP